MAGDHSPPCPLAHLDRSDRLGQRPDLVDFHQQGVGHFLLDRPLDKANIGHQQVVAHQLDLAADPLVQQRPALPVVLGHSVFDADDREAVDPVGPEVDHLAAVESAALDFQQIGAGGFVVELAGGRVERNIHILTRPVARLFDRLKDHFDGADVAAQAGGKAPLVPDIGGKAAVVQHLFEALVDLGAPAQAFCKGRGADRHDHELLKVGAVGSMFAPIENVEHRHREGAGIDAAQVPVEGQVEVAGGRLGHSHADRQDGIGPQLALGLGAVQFQHQFVDRNLFDRVHADQFFGNCLVDVLDRLEHPFAAVAPLVAVAQFQRLIGAGAGPARHDRRADAPTVQPDLHLHGRVAAAVEHLTTVHIDNFTHKS